MINIFCRSAALGALTLLVLLVPATTAAMPILGTSDCTDPFNPDFVGKCGTAIAGLEVGGELYDVTFELGTFIEVFGDPNSASFLPPAFWENLAGAQSAEGAIIDVLNDPLNCGGQPCVGVISGSTFTGQTIIPLNVDLMDPTLYQDCAPTRSGNALIWVRSTPTCNAEGRFFTDTYVFAVFTSKTVPEPTTLALLILGIAVVGATRRQAMK